MVLKRPAIFLFCLLFGAVLPLRGTTLVWDPSTNGAAVIRYNVYERLSSDYVLVGSVVSPQTTYDLPALTPGNHIFTVTAVGALIESRPSNEMIVSSFGSSLDFTSSAPLTIATAGHIAKNDADYPSKITVSGMTQPISNIRVTLRGLTHTVAAQLDILLVGPLGQKTMLMSDVGGRNPIVSADLVFSDHADQSFSTDPIQSGTYKPTNLNLSGQLDDFPLPAPARPYSKTLSVFNGTYPNGTWRLFVLNDAVSGSGTIAGGWSIRFEALGAPIVATFPAIGVTSTTATLNGIINPMGQPSSWAFYFGLTSDYTNAPPPQDAGNGMIAMPATLVLTGLKPATKYHYELIGQNVFGVTTTDDATFTTSTLIDSDRDGMPDDYELLNHLNPNASTDAARDSDGDGLSNLQEYLAGTNPGDNRSALRILTVQKSWTVSVTFSTVPGKRYQLERTTNLAQPSWFVLPVEIQGTGQPVTLADPWGVDLPAAFYRAVVIP